MMIRCSRPGYQSRGPVAASRCEICERPATHICGGLDVPMLAFCAECVPLHEQVCPDIRAGRAQMARAAAPEE